MIKCNLLFAINFSSWGCKHFVSCVYAYVQPDMRSSFAPLQRSHTLNTHTHTPFICAVCSVLYTYADFVGFISHFFPAVHFIFFSFRRYDINPQNNETYSVLVSRFTCNFVHRASPFNTQTQLFSRACSLNIVVWMFSRASTWFRLYLRSHSSCMESS